MHKELLSSAKSVEKVYNQLCEQVFLKYDIGKLELSILMFLEVNREATARDIVEINHVSKSSVSQAIDGLMKKGLVKGKHNEKDRRYVILELEESAKEILQEADQVNDEFQKIVAAGIPQEDLAVFQRTLKHMLNNIVEASKEIKN